MKNYQLDYSLNRPQMYDKYSRERRAIRMIKTLEKHFGKNKLKTLELLDIGASTGIIANILADKFSNVVGIDIDKKGIIFARKNNKKKNLKFAIGDAMNLNFKKNSFDVIICAHIYEHVPNPDKLFSEIYRVLRPSGICYFAATNKLWPWEPHYDLPFLSWLPKPIANFYVRLFGKAEKYHETPKTYWGLKRLTSKFRKMEYTQKILINPKKFGYGDAMGKPFATFAKILSPLAKYFSPTFFWLLIKD